MVTSYALVAPAELAQEARAVVERLGIGRADLKIGRRGGEVLLPVREPFDPMLPGTRLEVVEFAASRPPRSYKDVAQVPAELRPLLPSSFDVIGDLVVIKVPDPLRPHATEIGRAILEAHKNLRGVFLDEGVSGVHRVRAVQPLAGDPNPVTVHTEFGARFKVDLTAAYFSPRLANEHHRVASAVKPGESFVDATCGVGPFAILAAKRGVAKKIVAVDVNPRALALLRENLTLNRVKTPVEAVEADAVEVLGRIEPPDRVVVNLPQAGAAILGAAWRAVRPGGHLHYYAIHPETSMQADAQHVARRLNEETGREGILAGAHVVHPYSPVDRLVAMDFTIGATATPRPQRT